MDKKMTEEECIEMGGHCFEVQNYHLTIDPPLSVRICKHCGKTEYGHSQPSTRWE